MDERNATRKTIRLLHVEDSPGEAEIIHDMLESSGSFTFDLTHFTRLSEALDRMEPGRFDLALLDLSLPDSHGLDTFRRAHARCPSTPIIVLTNHKDEEMGARAVELGAQDYLVKQDTEAPLLHRSIRYALGRAAAERALLESEERYSLAIRGANDGIWDWDLRQRTIHFSPRWKEMLGFEEDEIGPDPIEWFERVHPADHDRLTAALEAHIAGSTPHFQHEYRIRHRDGSYLWMLARGLAIRDGNGRAYRIAGSQTDITERKRIEAQLVHDAFHDSLTGLANRALFLDRLTMALAGTLRKNPRQFAVLFLDLDRFKNINDTFGHATGDRLLKAIGKRLAGFLRPDDTLARLGGDEFAILAGEIGEVSDAVHLANRVQGLLSRPFTVGGQEIFVTASIGLALSSTGYEHAEDLLRDADIAMYRAKASGKNRYEIFDQEMHRNAAALLKLEMDLRRALERNEFVVYYQPIVDLNGPVMIGFEALVRWQHPERGLMTPTEFIAVAEETGLIVPLGWWVLEASCRQVARWQRIYRRRPPLSVSANVSGKLFMQPQMVDRVLEILDRSGLEPGSLRLEITENVLLDHGDPALAKMAELRALGVQLHVDDFGTGYSSLSYLQRFHYDTLKIDRSFVADLAATGEASAIIETILALANLLGMNVIAEGVETASQAAYLKKLHCPQAQGFWFSRPLTVEATEQLLASDRFPGPAEPSQG